ncbi:MAG: hypothetical protein ACR2PK_08445 [Acidimicrobiales bacterium]
MRPTTAPGKWSICAIIAFGLLLGCFALLVANGQRGGDDFFDNLWLTLPMVGAFVAAISALILGLVAIIRDRERSIAVIAATVIGLLVVGFGAAELILPH